MEAPQLKLYGKETNLLDEILLWPHYAKMHEGVRCAQSEIQRIIDLVKNEYPDKIICRRAKFHRTEYALDCVEI